MSVTAVQLPRLSTLLRLGRISNVPTVWTNVLAGSVVAGGGQRPDQIALLADGNDRLLCRRDVSQRLLRSRH